MTRTIEVADLFAGAGGMTTGAYMAAAELGLSMRVVAVNHWKAAIETHKRNHPDAAHFEEPVERIAPGEAVPGGRLDLLMAAPECIYHSNARADRPINDQRRSTAWGIMNWPSALHIDRILIENVPQFRKWGDRTKDGSVYRAFLRTLEAFGFVIDVRVLCAADYGDATTRERLFIQGVRPSVGRIVWPEPTHAEQTGATLFGRQLKPWRPAADVIDWTITSRSIFTRPKALAPATMNRIEIGLRRCNGRPFLIPQHGGGYPRSVDDPMPTIATAAAIGLVQPILVPYYGNGEQRATGLEADRYDHDAGSFRADHADGGGGGRDASLPTAARTERGDGLSGRLPVRRDEERRSRADRERGMSAHGARDRSGNAQAAGGDGGVKRGDVWPWCSMWSCWPGSRVCSAVAGRRGPSRRRRGSLTGPARGASVDERNFADLGACDER